MKTERTKDKKIKIFRFLCSVSLCVALMFALLEMGKISAASTTDYPIYYGLTMLVMALYEMLSFAYRRVSAPAKSDYAHIGYSVVSLAMAVCVFVATRTSTLFVIASAIYLVIPAAKRIIAIIKKRNARSRIYNSLVLVVCLLSILITLLFLTIDDATALGASSVFTTGIVIITTLCNIILLVFSQFNKEVLLRIVRKTYAGEIVIGLFLLIVAFSLVLLHNEESIKNFGDALWYCFAVISTIGFGDIAAATLVGRILTVILGLYGIVVTAIFTSIIVNFYNEVKNIKSAEEQEGEDQANVEDVLPDPLGSGESQDKQGVEEDARATSTSTGDFFEIPRQDKDKDSDQ